WPRWLGPALARRGSRASRTPSSLLGHGRRDESRRASDKDEREPEDQERVDGMQRSDDRGFVARAHQQRLSEEREQPHNKSEDDGSPPRAGCKCDQEEEDRDVAQDEAPVPMQRERARVPGTGEDPETDKHQCQNEPQQERALH